MLNIDKYTKKEENINRKNKIISERIQKCYWYIAYKRNIGNEYGIYL